MSDDFDTEDARARLDAMERLLQLLADALGVDLARLVLADRVERRGFPIGWDEFDAIDDPLEGP